MIKEKLKSLPNKPGCYLMKDVNNKIIYVGKAKDLSKRVKSYFVGSHDKKTQMMVSLVKDFEYIITSSETEAFILEMNLIKEHLPKYNILLTDDKSYPFIGISYEKNPKIYYTRDLRPKRAKYYGPYPNAKAARATVDLLNKMYPLRKCNKLPKKPCLYYHIGQCLAPCINDISNETYKEIIDKINLFLKGNVVGEIKDFEKKMKASSICLDYEKAKEYRDIISDLNVIKEKQKMMNDLYEADVIDYVSLEETLSIQVFHIRDAKMVERNAFLFENETDIEEAFVSFLGQFYLNNNNPIPKEIILPELDYLFLPDEIKSRITIPKKGRKKELLELVKDNARDKLKANLEVLEKTVKKFENIKEKLKEMFSLESLDIIESFDNSSIQGEFRVSAMVVFKDLKKAPNLYRKFKSKTSNLGDTELMYEVIKRRYKRVIEESLVLPSLVLIDGGPLQVDAAKNALKELGLNLKVAGLVKNDQHKTSHIYFENKEIYLEKSDSVFLFLENIQNETHRYAISYYRSVHAKSNLESEISKIKGIGKTKLNEILKALAQADDFVKTIENLKLTTIQKEALIKLVKRNN
ncbi:MAG: excinuclease ABC subunit UvrC [Bacilli bacterium]|nr:excinuclease ABC subunit UvrC [Bacilli bacterium]